MLGVPLAKNKIIVLKAAKPRSTKRRGLDKQ